ncbi:MAG: hypothetical protein K0R54_607 [Clostridiaceae bacterium]|jgi:hypothetical protein|nr:hypothetical protein [Clostridiaceae bacterium]
MERKDRDFSIRAEIEVELNENLSHLKDKVDIDKIYNGVECDELLIDMISLSIYAEIKNQLQEQEVEDEEVEYKINTLKKHVVDRLTVLYEVY